MLSPKSDDDITAPAELNRQAAYQLISLFRPREGATERLLPQSEAQTRYWSKKQILPQILRLTENISGSLIRYVRARAKNLYLSSSHNSFVMLQCLPTRLWSWQTSTRCIINDWWPNSCGKWAWQYYSFRRTLQWWTPKKGSGRSSKSNGRSSLLRSLPTTTTRTLNRTSLWRSRTLQVACHTECYTQQTSILSEVSMANLCDELTCC